MGWPLALAVGISAPAFAQTLPQGGTVVGGSGTITQTNANQLTINQASQNLAIDWQSFSIGANNIVRFVQPSTSAVALNRVLNGDPSQIYGQIQANGQVVIMSPNGIVFGPNSRVDVNALVATTANISTLDFMSGKLLFDQASSDANARVVNQGVISVAQGGFAVLAAASVSNQGQILANGGTVVLGGTKTFAIDFHGDGLLKFAATGIVDQKPAGADALVENSGSIEANGGRVLLTARAARSVLDNVINTTGIVVARTASLVNGEIVIDGGDSGIVSVNGTLDASGAAGGETGGTVKVLGEKVGLFENARIDASGAAGGGTVLVGGNYQGKGPEANAQYLYMDARAVIDASAMANGDGGRVILWSDLYTSFQGTISARGGAAGGNGGFVETSSKGNLQVQTGRVDAAAPLGLGGKWLLDPRNVSITTATAGGAYVSDVFTPTADNATIDVASIVASLNSGVNVEVNTGGTGAQAGDITVDTSIAKTAGGNATLTLNAAGSITTSYSITSIAGQLGLNLWAGGTISVGATVTTNNGSISTAGTNGTGSTGGLFTASGAINAGSGNVTINTTGGISMPGVLTSTGTVTLNADGGVTAGTIIQGPANLVIGGTGTVTLTNAANSFSNITINRAGTSANVSITNAISGNFQTSTLGSGTFTYSSATAGFLQSGGITQDAGGGAVSISGGTGNVTLSQANSWSGDLTVSGAFVAVSGTQTFTNAAPKTATFLSLGDITINGSLLAAGGAAVDMIFNTRSAGAAYGSIEIMPTTSNVSISTDGGYIVMGGGTGGLTNALPGVSNAAIGGGGIVQGVKIEGLDLAGTPLGVSIDTGGGNFFARGTGAASGTLPSGFYLYSGVSGGTVSIVTGAGNISIAATGNGGTDGGAIFMQGADAANRAILETVSGSITLDGTGTPQDGLRVAYHSTIATTSGTMSLTGTSSAARGIWSLGVVDAGSGATTISANGASYFGMFINNAEWRASTGGSITATGTSPTASILGIASVNSTFVLNGGTISLTGSGGAGTQAIHLTDTTIAGAVSGTLNIAGTGANPDVLVYRSTVGIASISASTQTLNLTSAGAITIQGTNAADTIAASSGALNVTADAGTTVSVTGRIATTGTGHISLNAARNVVLDANLTTAGGDILVKGNVVTWTDPFDPMVTPTFGTTSGSFDGVVVNSGVSINANGGDIAIAGKGGNTGANQHGVRMYAAAATPTTIATTGAGTITLYGQGGQSTGNGGGGLGGSHGGFRFDGNATGVIDISTQHGDIKMVGAGGGTGVTSDNNGGGVFFYTKVRATGSGSIDIAGTPGVGASVGLAAIFSQTEISTVSGNIALTGTGGTAYVNDAAFAGSAKGLWLTGATVKTTGSGGITLRGIAGTEGPGILISDVTYGAATLGDAAMTGNLTIQTDSLTYTGTNTILHQAGTGILTFRTDTAPTNLVFYGSGGGLQLTSTIVNAFAGNFATLAIGDLSQTGTITTGAAFTAASGQSLSLTTGGNLTVNYALATAGTGAISLTSAKGIALLGNVTTAGGDIVMMGGNVGPWSSPFTNPTPTYGAATGTFVGVAIGSAIQVTAGANGNIAIAGRGGDTGGSQYGIQMYSGATVSTSGTGTINMVGRGGGNGDGMAIDGATISSTGSGAIQMVGLPGTTTGGGFLFSGAVTLGNAAYTGNLTLRSDGAIAGAASVALPHQTGTGTFTLRTHTDATPIFAATSGAGLEFASSLLSAATAYSGITVGSATQTGAITMGAHTMNRNLSLIGANAPISIAGVVDLGTYTLSLETGGAVTQSAAITGTGGVLALGGTGSGAVTLTNGGNSFGLLSLGRTNNTGNVTVSTTADLQIIGDWSSAAMDVTANSIVTNGALNATGGSLELNATQFINVQHNISTNGGAILLLGNASWATAPTGNPTFNSAAGNFTGVSIAGISVDAGSGGIYIAGAGGTNASGLQHGVMIIGGGTVVSSGEIKIYGQGGTNAGSYNSGLTIDGGTINASGGDLTIVATGGAGAGTLNLGLYATSSASITGGGGVMSITATGGTSSGAGLSFNGASITATGATTLALSGASSTTYGIEGFSTASSIATASGALTMNATGDVYLPTTAIATASAPLSVTTTANVTLTNVANAIGGTLAVAATGDATVVNSVATLLGTTSVGGNLAMTVNSGAITQAAAVNVGGNASFTAATTLDLATNGSANTFGGTVTLTNSAPGAVILVAGTGPLALGSITTLGNFAATAVGMLTLQNANSFASGRIVDLTATGASAGIAVNGAQTLSNGNFTATSDRSIAVTADITTNGGNITMYANAPSGNVNSGTGTGSFHGVRIDGAIAVDAAGGNIDIRGRAGDTGSYHGITIRNGAGVLTGGNGTISLTGHGGTSTAGGSVGVEFYVGGAYAETQDGALTVVGYGGTGGGGNNAGVALATGEIRATATGAVSVNGTGGAGGSVGVILQGGGTTRIAVVDGDLTVSGTGGTGNGGVIESWGVGVAGQTGQGTIQSTGLGDVTVTGSAGGTTGDGRYGVVVGAGGSIVATSAAGGLLSVTGTGGSGTGADKHGIYLTGAGATIWGQGFSVSLTGTGGTGGTNGDGIRLDNGANTHSEDGVLTLTGVGTGTGVGIAATGTGSTIGDPASAGNITLVADAMSFSAATLGIETAGQVILRPFSTGASIGIGGGAGTLQLPDDMSFVDADTLVVGDPTAGVLTVGASGVAVAATTDLGLRGSSIALNGGVTLGAAGTLTLYANNGGATQAGTSTISAANLVLRGAGDFAVNRNGTGYNNITNVAADVAAGSGSGAIVLYTGAGGVSSANALADAIGTVNGITTPGGLTWVAMNGLTQTNAGLVSAGFANLTAQNGTLDLSLAANVIAGPIAATSATSGVLLANTGNTVLGNIASNGVLNVSVTGGTLTQTNGTTISTTGNATVSLAGAYAMTLTQAGNNVGGNLTLSGSTGTLNGTLGGSVSVTNGTFLINGTTFGNAPATTNTTTPAPGAGAGGTTISSALTDAAPVSQIQAAANLPQSSSSSTVAVVADTIAALSGGTGPLLGGAPAGQAAGAVGPGASGEGGGDGPAVSPTGVVIAPTGPSGPAASPGGSAPAGPSGGSVAPAIVVSSGPNAGAGTTNLVPTNSPPPAVTATTNIGGAQASANNGGVVNPPSSRPQNVFSGPLSGLR